MRSIVWDGDVGSEQGFGCTDLFVEPWWPAKGCHWHCGIDVSVALGAQLRAARAGVVRIVGTGELGIGVGAETDFYIHIDHALVVPGQAVARGQTVAISGAKIPAGGIIFGPHLHFEVQTGLLNVPWTSRNPVPVLSASSAGGGEVSGQPAAASRLFYMAGEKTAHAWGRATGAVRSLLYRRFDGTTWGAWRNLGGVLAADEIAGFRDADGAIHIIVRGQDIAGLPGNQYEIVSKDDGLTWSAFTDFKAEVTALFLMGPTLALSAPASPDLTPILQASNEAKAAALGAESAAAASQSAAQSAQAAAEAAKAAAVAAAGDTANMRPNVDLLMGLLPGR